MDAVPDDLLRQRDFLRRLARALTGDAAAAEDVVQEVELRALTHAPATGPLAAWLTTVTRRLAANVRRARARREEHERGAARAERIEGPVETLAGLELQERVLAAVRALEEPYRTTLWLRYYEDLAPRAIAGRVEVPLATVKTRLARGLALLRARLDAEHGGRRESWALALAPLAKPSAPLLAPLTLGGMWTMKKLALAAVVLVVAWVGYRETRTASNTSAAASVDSAAVLAPAPVATSEEVAPPPPSVERSELTTPEPTPTARGSAATLLVTARWDPEGDAAADLGLVLMPAEGDARELRAHEARTDSSGVALLSGIASGAWVLHDERGGELELELAPGEERHVELRLAAMLSVTGRVVDEDGRGIPRAEVWLERMWSAGRGSPLLDGRVIAHADDRGEFRLRGLRAENALGAFAPGYSSAPLALLDRLVPLPGGDGLEVELVLARDARRLAGQVLDADGSPCAGALLVLGGSGNEVRGDSWRARGRLFKSDAQGRFEADWIAPDWGAESMQLQLAVLAPEHALLLLTPSEVFGALDEELVLRLQRGARVTGQVRSMGGAPVPGARVEVLECAGRNAASVPFGLPSLEADASGNFVLQHVTSGAIRVAAWSAVDRAIRGLREGEVIDGADYSWDFVLGELAAIRGRVVDEQGLPLAERGVIVGNARQMSGLTSAADGTFEYVPEDPESEWTFSLVGAAGYDDMQKGVKLGQEVVLVARRHSGVVVGAFRDAVGAAKPGQALLAELMTVGDVLFSAAGELDGDGAFRFEQVAAGEYQLHITCGGAPIASSETFTLEAGGFRDLGELVSR